MSEFLIKSAGILFFVLISFLMQRANLERQIRSRQFLMPLFAVIYVLITAFYIHRISGYFTDIFDEVIINIFFNAAAAVVYIPYKKIIVVILEIIFRKNNFFHNRAVDRFYEYFPEKSVWCLKEEYVQARKLAGIVWYSSVVLLSAIMVISEKMYESGRLVNMFYPVFSVILIGEVYAFLGGASKTEYLREILGENENRQYIVNYALLRKYLRMLFGDKVFSENTKVNIDISKETTNDEVIEDLLKNPDPKINDFALYLTRLNREGVFLEHSYIYSTVELLNGKSILFNNPFYRDLIPYAFYPVNRTLLRGKKVLIVLGRHSIENDIIRWVEDGIETVTHIPFLWKIGILGEGEENPDIGILTRSRIIDAGIKKRYEKFFRKTEFVFILEPSLLITTAQIGVHTIAELCGEEEKKTVYCLCDKNCDGLVDAMSHILMTDLTEVSATNKHKGTLSYMCWEADREYLHHRQVPDIAGYLGMGTELSFAALKNQVSRTFWYGGSAFPVTDMQWIARQYYYELMKYADLPTSQEVMESCFVTTPNFWSAEISENNYFTVEDESFNMYEILREFSTRSTNQGFVNVISSSYLLKEYMADNDSIFENDAKAIPYIVADFVRTPRNIILVLLLLMSEYGVDEEKIRKEFTLAGLPVYPVRKQLWYEIFCTFSTVKSLAEIPKEYRQAVETVFTRTLTLPDNSIIKEENVIRTRQRYSVELGRMQTVYFLTDKKLISYFVSGTKSASYVSEDEKGERYYLGSELCGHIYQKLLPKQFFTYSGKYYEMLYVTSAQQVLVRRAADHINGRPSYRQIRHYHISAWKTAETIGAVQQTETMTVTRMYADFSVQTDGYFVMNVFNDFANAEKVVFQGEKSRIPDRSYLNKAMLKLTLPSEGLNDKVRYTIVLLMNEIFRTLFAENSPYIVALTDISHIDSNSEVSPLTYDVTLPPESEAKSSIFIAEDSHPDMGLLVTVERNLKRIFRIMQDYLLWNTEKLQSSRDSKQAENSQNSDNAVFRPLPYEERYYLLYGMEKEPDVLAVKDTLAYLNTVLKGENALEKTRKGVSVAEIVKQITDTDNPNVRKCDFCGNEIYGTEYETLADGRDRCMRCSRTAVKTEEEFVRIFEDVKRNMEMFFNIKINTGIKIEMVNARRLNKAANHTFVPTADFDGRVIGAAIHRHGCFSIMIENGSPRMMTILTMAHELTHIWQYLHWKQSALLKKYGKNLNLQIYEGMAKWVEIQYAYLINEPYAALREEKNTVNRNDEYGKGYLRYKANYPLSTGTVLSGKTPFMNVDEPLAMLYCQENNSPTLSEDNP